MKFRVLGNLEAIAIDGPLPIRSPRQQVVLLMLLLAANREVTTDRLVEAVWDDDPPATARGQVQICVSRLRKSLARVGSTASIVTRMYGYSLQIDAHDLDLFVFEDLVESADKAAGEGLLQEAECRYREAVAMWPPEGNLPNGNRVLDAITARLIEKRLSAFEEWVRIRLSLGLTTGLAAQLMDLVAEHPLRERLRAQLMDTLFRLDRRAEALETYRAGRRILLEELGIEPGAELREVQRRILVSASVDERGARPAPPSIPHRPAEPSVEERVRIVLDILAGDINVPVAARICRVPEQAVAHWRSQFLEGGRASLAEALSYGSAR